MCKISTVSPSGPKRRSKRKSRTQRQPKRQDSKKSREKESKKKGSKLLLKLLPTNLPMQELKEPIQVTRQWKKKNNLLSNKHPSLKLPLRRKIKTSLNARSG